ncbi:MAG: response regulator [Alphaproteobacteria bacterium]|nr:response regulator [Alphaproteobacteria bacterium]
MPRPASRLPDNSPTRPQAQTEIRFRSWKSFSEVIYRASARSNFARRFTLLKGAGHRCEVAENGQAAIEAVQAAPYDLVLMDVQMPVLDGISATRAIRALPTSTAAIPIVALTADAFAEQVRACREAGMDDHLSKPINTVLLDRVLARIGATLVR